MKKICFLTSLMFLFSACSVSVPTAVKYKVSPDKTSHKIQESICKEKSVKVSSSFINSSLMSKDMSYVRDGSKVFKYSKSAWLNKPSDSVTRELVSMLREIDIYKSVQEFKSRSRADLIVEVDLVDFMQYYSQDLKNSYVLVHIYLSIIDTKTSEIISTKTFKSKVSSKTLDAQGGVEALNQALNNVLDESSKWFIKGCK